MYFKPFKIMNYSVAEFSLLKNKDDNFGDVILQYLFEETKTSQTYIKIYNRLIHFGSDWFKQLKGWHKKHRAIYEIDGLFRTYFHYLYSLNTRIVIDENWHETAKNMYNYLHSFWIESYGIDWTKLNKILNIFNGLSKNIIEQTNEGGHCYKVYQYSFDDNITFYDVVV